MVLYKVNTVYVLNDESKTLFNYKFKNKLSNEYKQSI